jgi:hypothetical protein
MPSTYQLVFLPGLACDARIWLSQLAAVATRANPPRTSVSDAHARHERVEAMAGAVLAEHDGPLVLCGASIPRRRPTRRCCGAMSNSCSTAAWSS